MVEDVHVYLLLLVEGSEAAWWELTNDDEIVENHENACTIHHSVRIYYARNILDGDRIRKIIVVFQWTCFDDLHFCWLRYNEKNENDDFLRVRGKGKS